MLRRKSRFRLLRILNIAELPLRKERCPWFSKRVIVLMMMMMKMHSFMEKIAKIKFRDILKIANSIDIIIFWMRDKISLIKI